MKWRSLLSVSCLAILLSAFPALRVHAEMIEFTFQGLSGPVPHQ